MHRSLMTAFSLFSLVAAVVPTAHAAVITQLLGSQIQPQGASSAHPITGDPFFPSKGTLTGVALELQGTLIPEGDTLPAASLALTTSLTVSPFTGGLDVFTRTFPSEIATSHGIVGEGPLVLYIAPSISVDETFLFTDFARFLFTGGDPIDLIDYGFSTTSSTGGLGLDRTNFEGSATLTYTYLPAGTSPAGVPEPASIALLGIGAATLAVFRRRGGLSDGGDGGRQSSAGRISVNPA